MVFKHFQRLLLELIVLSLVGIEVFVHNFGFLKLIVIALVIPVVLLYFLLKVATW